MILVMAVIISGLTLKILLHFSLGQIRAIAEAPPSMVIGSIFTFLVGFPQYGHTGIFSPLYQIPLKNSVTLQPKTLATFISCSVGTFIFPRSIMLTVFKWASNISANFIWEYPAFSLNALMFLPNFFKSVFSIPPKITEVPIKYCTTT